MANVTLKPGVVYPVKRFDAVRTGRAADYILLQSVTCFGPDGRITTLKGLRRAADLSGGDLVLTRAGPPQPLLMTLSGARPHRTAALARQMMVPPGWRCRHPLCARHQVIRGDGIRLESLLTGPEALRRLRAQRR